MSRIRLLLFSCFILYSGISEAQYITGPNGVKFFFWRNFNRPQVAKIGDLIFADIVAKNNKDSIILNSYATGEPFQLILPEPTYKGCFYEIFTIMHEGDSTEVQVIADSFFLKSLHREVPNYIKPGSHLRLTIKLVSVVSQDEYEKRMQEEGTHADENQKKEIEKYISENKLQMTETPSGLLYQFPLKGFGKRASQGDSVMIQYTGYFLDGKIFDSSIPDSTPFVFKVGSANVIKAWNEAIQLMSIRDKLLIIVPYQLAFGEKGEKNIPPFTPVVFEIELLDIKQ